MTATGSHHIFSASAKLLIDLFKDDYRGYRVPIYQRRYDWDKDNIYRLFEDILSGLNGRCDDPDSLTFIGTIILLEEKTDENNFDGQSFSIIDGQQRLTTLTLLAVSICLKLFSLESKISNDLNNDLEEKVYDWLKEELKTLRLRILKLIYGKLSLDGFNNFPFPKLVRAEDDHRDKSKADSDYNSIIATYLYSFALYISEPGIHEFNFQFQHEESATVFKQNVNLIENLVEKICDPLSQELSNGVSSFLPTAKDFNRKGFRSLLKKLPLNDDDDKLRNKYFSYLLKEEALSIELMRVITFANFLLDGVVVTEVIVTEEKYGFDIFDSLNTTGEPLTAIQTFKPQVIKFENSLSRNSYANSVSERSFSEVEKYLEFFSTADKKQRASKDLVIPFALYINGDRVSRSLDAQRRYLRSKYDKVDIANLNGKRRFVEALAETANFKKKFWDNKDLINELAPNCPEREVVLVCLKFLQELKTTLAIPLLTRYYFIAEKHNYWELFSQAVKAITGFVVFRRSVTSNTANIDNDFRSLMERGKVGTKKPFFPICRGLIRENEVVEISMLKKLLREWLARNRIEIIDKPSWLHKAKVLPLYEISTPLCKFLLLAAYNNSRRVEGNEWKYKKERKSREVNVLTYEMWVSPEAQSVEHVAPVRGNEKTWDKKIYSSPTLKNTLGNLTLLPHEENSAAGNRDWSVKKHIYKAFSATSISEIEEIENQAGKEGFQFSQKNREMLRKNVQLPLANPVALVKNWTAKIISDRSENICDLAWEEISSWVFE